ncbi:MAG: AAA family ATPase [Candidatus Diapherotrites archaeon]|uniref:DNA helicase n=1 Tax=Candidatus Iainarchaeum sp. TaxID=3101447 RepID=A0A2D6LPM5_9ARCH|nr:AAA family ATPase [Candidatus Diapherotrites archaeon]
MYTEETTREDNPFAEKFEEFFKHKYMKQIETLVSDYPQKRSLSVDFKDIEHYDVDLADELLVNSDVCLAAAHQAIKNIDVPLLEIEEFAPHIRLFNLPKEKQPVLRDVSSAHIGKLITVEGVIRQVTDVLPKIKFATWKCSRCDATYKIPQKKNITNTPSMCSECKNRTFTLEEETSEFEDYQKIQIQEPLEILKGSEQATNLDIYINDDFVNMVAPGDRTKITGILRLMPPKEKKVVYGRYLEAHHLEETEKEFEDIEIDKDEEKEIKELAKRDDVYDLLTQSIAPHIYGHETMKEAIALQMFGGVKKTLPGEQKVRGNIHVLIVGDPGLAKSAILRATDSIAPKSIYVAGKTTSGAGITATAVKDEFGDGGWTLKAGALVLASGGMAMVDEFDKMDPDDRSAMHEALEQQQISIAKAGIVTKFKTDTSVLAAANPKYSRFDPYQPFIDQVNLPPTLLSRFDLFFMMRDVLDRTKDLEIAGHILKSHRAGEMIIQRSKKGIGKKNKLLEELTQLITPKIDGELLKKYISYARQKVFPVLSDDGMKKLSDFYISLRDQGRKEGSYAATHRQLEGLIRLAEASARVRLSDAVEEQDVERSVRLVRTSLEDLVTDPETGKIDIDIITSGQTHTQLGNLKKVLGIIKEKAQELDIVPIEEVITEAKTLGMESDKVKEIISKLEKSGDVYKPKHGFVKPT